MLTWFRQKRPSAAGSRPTSGEEHEHFSGATTLNRLFELQVLHLDCLP